MNLIINLIKENVNVRTNKETLKILQFNELIKCNGFYSSNHSLFKFQKMSFQR